MSFVQASKGASKELTKDKPIFFIFITHINPTCDTYVLQGPRFDFSFENIKRFRIFYVRW